MLEVYPFKAIIPVNSLRYMPGEDSVCLETKLQYINDLSRKRWFQQDLKESFCCCKISSKNSSTIGLIALINTRLANEIIFRHERFIETKRIIYANLFKKYRVQLAPIVLAHEHNFEIDKYLKQLITENLPFLEIKDQEYTYELWRVNNLFTSKNLYRNIGELFLADGHHRLSTISPENQFVSAFLMSKNYLDSTDIYREYLKVNKLSQTKLLLFLNYHFSLKQTEKIQPLNNRFIFKFGSDLYEAANSNSDYSRRRILEFLDSSLNYNNGKLNFHNHRYNSNFSNNTNLSVFIPSFKIVRKICQLKLYPPHSTLFYPKLPQGLISYRY